jgi:putative Mg2+ transporter-C (MgtC) family protein
MQGRGTIRGVTTAAAIWVTAAMGAACGLGYYAVAGFALALAMLILWLSPIEKQYFGDKHTGGHLSPGAMSQAQRQSRRPPP